MPKNQMSIPSNVDYVRDRDGLLWRAGHRGLAPDAVIWDSEEWTGDAFQSNSEFLAKRGPVSW